MRTICIVCATCYGEPFLVGIRSGGHRVYICNCNGIRERDVARAIEAGAQRPRDVFAHHDCKAQCAKCVCEMRAMIQDAQVAYAMAAE